MIVVVVVVVRVTVIVIVMVIMIVQVIVTVRVIAIVVVETACGSRLTGCPFQRRPLTLIPLLVSSLPFGSLGEGRAPLIMSLRLLVEHCLATCL